MNQEQRVRGQKVLMRLVRVIKVTQEAAPLHFFVVSRNVPEVCIPNNQQDDEAFPG